MPVLASINPWALLLSLAAMVAIFRFKAGTIQTLAACSAAGVVLYLHGARRAVKQPSLAFVALIIGGALDDCCRRRPAADDPGRRRQHAAGNCAARL